MKTPEQDPIKLEGGQSKASPYPKNHIWSMDGSYTCRINTGQTHRSPQIFAHTSLSHPVLNLVSHNTQKDQQQSWGGAEGSDWYEGTMRKAQLYPTPGFSWSCPQTAYNVESQAAPKAVTWTTAVYGQPVKIKQHQFHFSALFQTQLPSSPASTYGTIGTLTICQFSYIRDIILIRALAAL